VVSIQAYNTSHGARGLTQVGPITVDTTGVLGWSRAQGQWASRAWPGWITIPSFQDLADARRWHFLVAWILVANGLAYGLWALLSGHAWRDLRPTRADLRSIPRSIVDHIKLKHPTGEAAKRYNVLQRFAYIGVIALIAGMVATGLTMSPGVDAAAPWLLDLFGGRQSARTLHFVFASLIVLFVLVHLTEVVLAGPLNEVRSMITGRYAVPPEHD
jgi:thiosulfate reductase cytochrome b subunit